MAGGTNWMLLSARDASDPYQKERASDGFVAWFVRDQYEFEIEKDINGFTMPDALGTESGFVQFAVGGNVFTRTIAGKFRCAADDVQPAQKPLNYTARRQKWVYIGPETRLTEWASPDDDDGGIV